MAVMEVTIAMLRTPLARTNRKVNCGCHIPDIKHGNERRVTEALIAAVLRTELSLL
jgi:hypothetical protein